MSGQQSSYRQILKGISIFGSVQVFSIFLSIVRSKFVAVLLGTTGMGIAGLLTSTVGLISGLTNCGLGTSAVRDVASANATGDEERITTVVTALRRWIWITGVSGAIIMVAFSRSLSMLTFGSHDYSSAFRWISITLLFNQLSSGQLVVLQGMRKLQYLAKASMFGSALGLILTIPLYYRFRINGIVPSIIISSLISLLLSWYFAKKVKRTPTIVSLKKTFSEGKNMLLLGFLISLSGLISIATSYVVRIYISNKGGVEQVGLFTAGYAIINNYVGLIFSAMATDYYPRLSAVSNSNALCKHTINQQAEIALLLLAPILIIFLVFIQWMAILLYSNKFIGVDEMIHWAALGMFFKTIVWSIGFILLAKGASKLFFWNELIGSSYICALNLLGYHFRGLSGIGISIMVGYVFYLIQIYIVSKTKYQFSFNSTLVRIFSYQFSLALICFCVVQLIGNPYSYFFGIVLVIISVLYSYVELDKRMDIKSLIINLKSKISIKSS